jgi:hypothetical protein
MLFFLKNYKLTNEYKKLTVIPFLKNYDLNRIDFVIEGIGKVDFLLLNEDTKEVYSEFNYNLEKNVNVFSYKDFEKNIIQDNISLSLNAKKNETENVITFASCVFIL